MGSVFRQDDRDFVFVPADLAEDVELPLDLKKQILYLHAHLPVFDHWQVLGVPWNAPPGAVRDAYLERVKLFHPDRHAGRRLGSYLGRIEAIFRALTEAREVLSDDARRAEYVRKTAPPEEFARMEMRRIQDEQRAEERRSRLARSNPLAARAARIQELMARGKQALAAGNFVQAQNDFSTVVGLDARSVEARHLAEEARRRAASERARAMYDEALQAEAIGNVRVALGWLRKLLETDPQDVRAATTGARLALEHGEVQAARAFADQAVRAGPRDAASFEALALVLHAQGETKEARRAAYGALAIDPGRASAKALLKKLRWGFLS